MSGSPRKFILFGLAMLTSMLGGQSMGSEKAPEETANTAKERPWVEVENKLAVLRSKRDASAIAMKKIREERDQLKEGSAAFKEKMKEYLASYKQWITAGEEYNQTLGVLKYRYPERVLKGPAKMEKMEHKTLEELDAELGIDGTLNKSIRKVRDQYGSEEGKTDAGPASQEATSTTKDPGSQDSLGKEPQIIMRK